MTRVTGLAQHGVLLVLMCAAVGCVDGGGSGGGGEDSAANDADPPDVAVEADAEPGADAAPEGDAEPEGDAAPVVDAAPDVEPDAGCVPADEQCNGLDDDCDGTADEALGGGPCQTGAAGICADGLMACVEGAEVCAAVAEAAEEVCNGLDDDCDGAADEATAGAACQTDLAGACAEGATTCVDGEPGCAPTVQPGAAAEACNGVDDDCDGATDEGLGGEACQTGLPGPCAGGVSACEAGAPVCVPAVEPGAAEEMCDGIDQDCDGAIDEDTGGRRCRTVSPGVCSVGATVCVDGALDCRGDVRPGDAPEQCNGLDDDCDGALDEDTGGEACPTGQPGVCAEGAIACVDGAFQCRAANRPGELPERCNGLDDDCDGIVDEAAGGDACQTGLPGVCSAGATVCIDGVPDCRGDVPPGEVPERCNGLDDDCDGNLDEATGGDACQTGQPGPCGAGVLACVDGAALCEQTVQPGVEACNELDDDCDGLIDEGACRVRECNGIRVALVGGGFYHDDLRLALDAEPDLIAERIDACDPETLAGYDVVVAHGNMSCFDGAAFDGFVQAGGGLIGIPWTFNNGTGLPAMPVIAPSQRGPFGGPVRLAVQAPADPLLVGVDLSVLDGACDDAARPLSADPDCVGFEVPTALAEGATLALTHTDDGGPPGPAAAWWPQGRGMGVYVGVHYLTSDTQSAAAHAWGRQLMMNAARLAAQCDPCPRVAEQCNGVDDDCDGAVDEEICPVPGRDCRALRVAIVGGGFYHDDLRLALDARADMTAERIDACDADTLAGYDAVVVHGNMACNAPPVFADYVRGGGGLVGTPWSIINGAGIDILPALGPAASNTHTGPVQLDVIAPDDVLVRGVDLAPLDGICGNEVSPDGGDPDCVAHEVAAGAPPEATVAMIVRGTEAPAASWWRQGDGAAVYLGVQYVTRDAQSAIFYPWGEQLMVNAIGVATRCVVPPAP